MTTKYLNRAYRIRPSFGIRRCLDPQYRCIVTTSNTFWLFHLRLVAHNTQNLQAPVLIINCIAWWWCIVDGACMHSGCDWSSIPTMLTHLLTALVRFVDRYQPRAREDEFACMQSCISIMCHSLLEEFHSVSPVSLSERWCRWVGGWISSECVVNDTDSLCVVWAIYHRALCVDRITTALSGIIV